MSVESKFEEYNARDKVALKMIDVLIENEDSRKKESENKPSKILGSFFPYVTIHDYYSQKLGFIIEYKDILHFELKSKSMIPSLSIRFADSSNYFSTFDYKMDNSVLNLYIKANNEELLKPLHLNLDILGIKQSGIYESYKCYTLECQLRIPNLYNEFCTAYTEMTSFDALLEIAKELKLGFYSNDEDTNDIMTWINPYTTAYEFISHLTDYSYKDQESFYTSYIDVYYNLTLANVNKCLLNDTINVAEIYTGLRDLKNVDATFEPIKLFLTNRTEYSGLTRFVTNYKLINTTTRSILENGYQRKLQYYDMTANSYLTDESMNIIPLAKSDYDEAEDVIYGGLNNEYVDSYIKYKYLGKQNENVHDYFQYSKIWNYHNLSTLTQNVLVLDLKGVDLSLYRYQTVPVILFSYDATANKGLSSLTKTQVNAVQLNEVLSGKYVIIAIDWIYTYPNSFFQRLYLVKRKYKNIITT